jgi:hypothetical protein
MTKMTRLHGKEPPMADPESDTGRQNEPDEEMLPALSHAGAVIEKAIEHLLQREIDPMAIASALLGGALSMMAHSLDDDAVLRVLENAMNSVRNGELDHIRDAEFPPDPPKA